VRAALGCVAAIVAATLLFLPVSSPAELGQRGSVRLSFGGWVRPKLLPRHERAPISVSLSGDITTTDGTPPPQLRRIVIEINRQGRIHTAGLPVCRLEQIQPATTERALANCGPSLVGEGSFRAAVALPDQSPFPSNGKLLAFNGRQNGRPVIFAHVYGTDPIPTSFALPLRISRTEGRFGTVLHASLPNVTAEVAVVTGISMRLGRRFSHRGRSRSYLSAGCPAPKGFIETPFRFARGSFVFVGAKALTVTLTRTCRARS
jgi:hypothetical protein